MAKREIDVLNDPILIAAELAMEQVRAVTEQVNNPLGQVQTAPRRRILPSDYLRKLRRGM